MTSITFDVQWSGELAAGIRAGYEEVTIQFRHDQPTDPNVIDYWRQAVEEFYDGAQVSLIEIASTQS